MYDLSSVIVVYEGKTSPKRGVGRRFATPIDGKIMTLG
jgi:hypothetical protein